MLVEGHEIYPINKRPFIFERHIMRVTNTRPTSLSSGNQFISKPLPARNSIEPAIYEYENNHTLKSEHIVGNKCPYLNCLGSIAGYVITSKIPTIKNHEINSIILPEVCILPNGNMCQNPGPGCFLHINDLSLHEHNYPGRIPYFKHDLFKHFEQNIPFDIFRL